jgi:hypothetical protein
MRRIGEYRDQLKTDEERVDLKNRRLKEASARLEAAIDRLIRGPAS